MASIPLHSLPDTLVDPTMIISAYVRQFIAKVEMALRTHRVMDSDAFDDLFKFFAATNNGLEETCKDIEAEVRRIEAATLVLLTNSLC